MQVFKTLFTYLVLVTFLTGCNKKVYNGKEYRVYTIKKHYSNHGIKKIGNNLSGSALFDSSAIYDLNGYDQINKLIGIGSSKHHENSIRIGWRCINEQIELFAYSYYKGVKTESYMCTVEVNTNIDFNISMNNGMSIDLTTSNGSYNWNSLDTVEDGSRWLLFPYFGGQMEYPNDTGYHRLKIYIALD